MLRNKMLICVNKISYFISASNCKAQNASWKTSKFITFEKYLFLNRATFSDLKVF